MVRLLPLLALMTGCKSCAERRAERAEERAMEELLPALEVEPVEVVAEVEEREDGGVEAWARGPASVVQVPAGWTLELFAEAPAWTYELEDGDCPDDVPLAWLDTFGDATNTATAELDWSNIAGGCDADGDDIQGDYEAGYTVEITARNDDGESYELTVAVPVDLTIE